MQGTRRCAASVFFAAAVCAASACGPPEAVVPSGYEVTDDVGRRVSVDAPAVRVFSAVPSLTESVLALASEDVLVARTRFDRAPELSELPSLGGTLNPNVEALARLRPDLVIVSADLGRRTVGDRMEALGVPVYRADVQTVADLRDHLLRLGVLLGREERAAELVDSLNRGLAAVQRAVAGNPAVDVYYSVWHDPPQTTGPGTFIDEVIELAGGRNVFADASVAWPQISLEELLRRDPEALVIAYHQGGAYDAPWLRGAGWRELSAVRRGRYTVVDGDLFNRPGPRLVEAARVLASFLHGDRVLREEW